MVIMNSLSRAEQAQIVRALVEGNSIRSTCRITGRSKGAVLKLLEELGEVCAEYHDKHVRKVRTRRLQCDEIWSFVGAKKKNTKPEKKAKGWGDVWTWTAIDADTKLCVSYFVGNRDAISGHAFMNDCSERVATRLQITTDQHRVYLDAVEEAFGADIDFAQLQKIYSAPSEEEQRKYSPARCIGCDIKVASGNPDPKHISTSYVERQNLSMRMGMRRFTRLTNGFSKKVENHCHAIALYFLYYNFARVHQTLRVTPAMEAGLCDHVWTVEEICNLLPEKKAVSSTAATEKAMLEKALSAKVARPVEI
jgi:IS1 family transposase